MKTDRMTRPLLLCLLFGLVGCHERAAAPVALGPVPDGPIMTDALEYVAVRTEAQPPYVQYQFQVITRLENRTTAPLFVGRCYPTSPHPIVTVVDAEPTGELGAYTEAFGCVGHDQQFEVVPGANRVDTLTVVGPVAFGGSPPKGIGRVTGTFQVSYDVRLARGDGAPVARESVRRSNVFRVRTAG